MNNRKKIFLRVIPVVFVLMVMVTTNVFGFSKFNTNMTIGTQKMRKKTAKNGKMPSVLPRRY